MRGVLLVVLSWQFLCVVPIAVSCIGCAGQQIDAPSHLSHQSQLTLESLHERNPKALATTVCVLPDQVPAGTKFFLADAKRTKFVSDQNREAFDRFLPFADTIFEFNLFARSSSAALLGATLNLSCPDTFVVTHSRKEIANGAPSEQLVRRISTDVHREFSSLVEQTCKAAALEGTDRLYVGQQSGKKDFIILNAVDPPTIAKIRRFLSIERIPEPKPSGPKPVLRQLMDTPQGEAVGGLTGGTIIALAPGGTIAADLAIEAHLLSPGTRNGRIGRAGGELCVGVVQVVVGCAGMGVGTGMSGTGGGAPVGVPVFVGSLGLTVAGATNCSNGLRHLAVELLREDDSANMTPSGSRAQIGLSEPTPVAGKSTTQSRATTPKAPETTLTVREAPVTKTTKTQAKGKPSDGGTPTGPVAKGAKRGPKTDPNAPHNAAIAREIKKLEAKGNKIIAGGDKDEKVVGTKGGLKDTRRPDIIYITPDGKRRGINVGKTNADGTPVKREQEALDDLNKFSNTPTDFVPYDR